MLHTCELFSLVELADKALTRSQKSQRFSGKKKDFTYLQEKEVCFHMSLISNAGMPLVEAFEDIELSLMTIIQLLPRFDSHKEVSQHRLCCRTVGSHY